MKIWIADSDSNNLNSAKKNKKITTTISNNLVQINVISPASSKSPAILEGPTIQELNQDISNSTPGRAVDD